ncbi:hypothetical protein Y1Q_0002626 [Alligator mississippiensis]|uniref:Uncharacterized protein n=1 Tax=Alligator mississippiensis TaxID=8496 RepID=A0A151NYL4_ALLMI|nr:hypothetical protein Y1Q_0002626 [Alligator mississippiensis]
MWPFTGSSQIGVICLGNQPARPSGPDKMKRRYLKKIQRKPRRAERGGTQRKDTRGRRKLTLNPPRCCTGDLREGLQTKKVELER